MTGLRFSMFAWGGLLLVTGAATALLPDRLSDFAGRDYSNTFLLGSLGLANALWGLGILLAGRDPVRHIMWVRLAIVSLAAGAVYDLIHYVAGTVILGVIIPDLAAYALFGALFILFYPRAPRMVPINVQSFRGPLYTDADRGGLFIRRGDIWRPYFLPAQEPVASPSTAPPTAPEAMAPPGPATINGALSKEQPLSASIAGVAPRGEDPAHVSSAERQSQP